MDSQVHDHAPLPLHLCRHCHKPQICPYNDVGLLKIVWVFDNITEILGRRDFEIESKGVGSLGKGTEQRALIEVD